MNTQKELYQFLNEWLGWKLAGATDDKFKRYYGLCDNLALYVVANHSGEGYLARSRILRHGLEEMFIDDNLDEVFPFNDIDTYGDEVRERLCHRNDRRVEWVLERVARGKAEGYLC